MKRYKQLATAGVAFSIVGIFAGCGTSHTTNGTKITSTISATGTDMTDGTPSNTSTGRTANTTTKAVTNNHTTPTTPKQTGFDYKKLLGFQPLLPSKVPSGYALKNIQAEIDTGAKIGNSYSITALYQNENREFRIWEAKSTVPFRFPSFSQKATLNGISGILYQADGYNFQFNKNGVVYRVEGGNLTYQQVGAVASSLTSLVQKKPDNIFRRTATK